MLVFSVIVTKDDKTAHEAANLVVKVNALRHSIHVENLRNEVLAIYDALVPGARVYVLSTFSEERVLVNNTGIVISKELSNESAIIETITKEFNLEGEPSKPIDTFWFNYHNFASVGTLQLLNLL